MKRKTLILLAAIILTMAISGCGSNTSAKKDWYAELLQYYKDGMNDGWKHEEDDFAICDEMKDPNNKFGYLLKDLDGDGIDELLIGIIDDSSETKFVDLCINHRDFGPTRSFACGYGYYIYLCDDNVIKMEKWYGSETQIDYMKYDSKDNSFPIIDEEKHARKYDLTPF